VTQVVCSFRRTLLGKRFGAAGRMLPWQAIAAHELAPRTAGRTRFEDSGVAPMPGLCQDTTRNNAVSPCPHHLRAFMASLARPED
jgi:hypothetical protein